MQCTIGGCEFRDSTRRGCTRPKSCSSVRVDWAARLEKGLSGNRKGVGTLEILDPDLVQVSNLNRQSFFIEDLYCNKATSLTKNRVADSTNDSVIVGHPFSFESALGRELSLDADVIVCGVDNSQTRMTACRYCRNDRPVVFLGVDELADHGYVFVQEGPTTCFACLFPHASNNSD